MINFAVCGINKRIGAKNNFYGRFALIIYGIKRKVVVINMDYKEIGERIARLRVEKSYSRDVFARQIGVSSRFLYDLEAGRKGFSVWVLYNISQALSVSCDYIVTGQEDSHYEKIGRIMTELCEEMNHSQKEGAEIEEAG